MLLLRGSGVCDVMLLPPLPRHIDTGSVINATASTTVALLEPGPDEQAAGVLPALTRVELPRRCLQGSGNNAQRLSWRLPGNDPASRQHARVHSKAHAVYT